MPILIPAPVDRPHAAGTLATCRPHCWPNSGSLEACAGPAEPTATVAAARNANVSVRRRTLLCWAFLIPAPLPLPRRASAARCRPGRARPAPHAHLRDEPVWGLTGRNCPRAARGRQLARRPSCRGG